MPDDTSILVSRPSWLGKITRKAVTEEDIKKAAEEIEREPGYIKNGWTPTTLAMYFKERRDAQSNTILHRKPPRPTRTVGWHNPHRWRK